MKKTLIALVTGFSLLVGQADAEVSLPFGQGEGKVSFWNTTIATDAEELDPAGPMSFRAFQKEFWVADSLAGRLLRLDQAGKQLAEVKVHDVGDNRIEDFALSLNAKGELDGFLVLTSEPAEVVRISLDGKDKKKLCEGFVQAQTIEVSPKGDFAVADTGKQLLTLYSAAGAKIRDIPWEWSGMCFDPEGNICYLRWEETAKINHLMVEAVDGKPVRKVALSIGDHTNPYLWQVAPDGSATVSFMPPEGFAGSYGIVVCDPAGKVAKSGKVIPPVVMNRFLVKNPAGEWFLGETDYNKAPEGTFKITAFSF